MKIAAGIAIAVLVIFSVASYTKNVEARALLRYRSDSLETARFQVAALQLERDTQDSVYQADTTRLSGELAFAVSRMQELRARNTGRRTVLDTVLVSVPDTVREFIVKTIDGLEEEAQACTLALGTCEAAVAVRDSMIAGRDSTISELRPLLTAYEDQLANAIGAARPPPTRWIERALAVYGIIGAIGLLTGN